MRVPAGLAWFLTGPCAVVAAQADVTDSAALLRDARGGSPTQRRQAFAALGALGEAAVPVVAELRRLLDEPALRWAVVRALGEIGPFAGRARDDLRIAVQALPADDGEHARERERALQRLGVDPSAGDDEVVARLEVPEAFQREFAAELLGRRRVVLAAQALADAVRAEHPPTLLQHQRGDMVTFTVDGRPGEAARTAAARALVRIAGGRATAVDAWVWLLQLGDQAERRAAAAALGRLGVRDARVVEPLVETLRWHDVVLVREAIASLSAIGPRASAAVPRLQSLCGHADRQIAQRAAAALRQIQGR